MPSTILSDNGVSSGTAGIKTTGSNDGILALQTTTAGGTATTAVTIDTNQNVGIGTSSPSTYGQLAVFRNTTDGTNANIAAVNAGATSAYAGFQAKAGTVDFQIFSDAAGNAIGTAGSMLRSNSNTPIMFGTNGTERMRIDSSGNLLVGITSARANAGDVQVSKGISFPATQSAQSDANTLDDYEEGTWTPTLTNGGTLSIFAAKYVKIGQQVTVSLYISNIAPTNNGSDFVIGGLPFASGGGNLYFGGSFGYVGDSNLADWLPITGSTFTYLYFHIQGATPRRTNAQYITAASGSVDELILTITYFT